MPGQHRLRRDDGGHLRQKLPSRPFRLGGLIAGVRHRSTAAADTEQAVVALPESQRFHRRVRAERRPLEAIHLAV
jgi:hypothetical protein